MTVYYVSEVLLIYSNSDTMPNTAAVTGAVAWLYLKCGLQSVSRIPLTSVEARN